MTLVWHFSFCPGCKWAWAEHGFKVVFLHPQFCRFHRGQLDKLIEDPNASEECLHFWMVQWQADLAKRYPSPPA